MPQLGLVRGWFDYGVSMALPSVLLHDHLDGGLRPSTIIELAEESGYTDLPAGTEPELVQWFDQSESGSLENYLEAFAHTIALMQRATALERIAYEAVVDLAADGVVYAEIRFCPGLFTTRGMTTFEVVETISSGIRMGERETGSTVRLIVTALRQRDNSLTLARSAINSGQSGVVGFDLAGPEAGNPPTDHLDAFRLIRESGLRLTVHAGEAGGSNGVGYIAAAMDTCGAERLGHGLEIINDCMVEDDEIVKLGRVASRVLDRQVPLEMCPASNIATNRLDPRDHPFGMLHRAGFNVTLNTDNRLMSNTSMSDEFAFATEHHGLDITDLALITKRSLAAAFCTYDEKLAIWEAIAARYRAAGVDVSERWRS
ncbi:MAG: adenosine deaminase [Acidimicrobiia bacterium]